MDLAAAAAVLMHSKPDISKVRIRSVLLSFIPNARTTQTIGISGVQSLYVILVFRCSRDLLTKYILIRLIGAHATTHIGHCHSVTQAVLGLDQPSPVSVAVKVAATRTICFN